MLTEPRRSGSGNENPIPRRLLRGIAWNTLGGALAQGGSFLGSIVSARILGKQAFGEFAMIQSTVVAIGSLAGLGLGITATKYVSQYRSTDPERVGRILGLSSLVAFAAGLCFSIGFLVVAPSLALGVAVRLFHHPQRLSDRRAGGFRSVPRHRPHRRSLRRG